MDVLQTEGIVLHTLPFKEYDRIITLFTPKGLCKLFIKGKKQNPGWYLALTTPFSVGQYLYVQGKSDLYRFHDGTLLQQNLRIRERLEALETAGKLTGALLRSQWPARAAPDLYCLFRNFLQKIPQIESPNRLVPLFLLKILKHEGMLQLTFGCSLCEAPVVCRFGAERYCRKHAPIHATFLTAQEESELECLANSRSLKEALCCTTETLFAEKVETLFEQAFV